MSLLVQLKFDAKKAIKGIGDDIISLFWKGMWSKITFLKTNPISINYGSYELIRNLLEKTWNFKVHTKFWMDFLFVYNVSAEN